jgi:hypothetical protein
MPPVGFESTISADERPKTYALDRAATGTGSKYTLLYVKYTTRLMDHLLLEENNIFGTFWRVKKKNTSNLRFALIFQFGKKMLGGK